MSHDTGRPPVIRLNLGNVHFQSISRLLLSFDSQVVPLLDDRGLLGSGVGKVIVAQVEGLQADEAFRLQVGTDRAAGPILILGSLALQTGDVVDEQLRIVRVLRSCSRNVALTNGKGCCVPGSIFQNR